MIINANDADRRAFSHKVEDDSRARRLRLSLRALKSGFNVTQVYGLTETYGHTVMQLNEDWDDVDFATRASIKARQGVAMTMTEEATVLDRNKNSLSPVTARQSAKLPCAATPHEGVLEEPDATPNHLTAAISVCGFSRDAPQRLYR